MAWIITGKTSSGDEHNLFVVQNQQDAKAATKALTAIGKYHARFERRFTDEFVPDFAANNPHAFAPVKPAPSERFATVSELVRTKLASKEEKTEFRWLQAAHIQRIEDWKKRFVVFAENATGYRDAYRRAERWWRAKHYDAIEVKLKTVLPYWREEFIDYRANKLEMIE
jgi:hypothetical protein